MRIAYIIPDLKTKGGIQEFAVTVKSHLQKKYHVDVENFNYHQYWFSKIGPLYQVFLRLRGFYYNHVARYDLIHVWHIGTAQFLKKNSYIITCHGLEILPKNVDATTKRIYQQILDNARFITADSSFTKKLLLENYTIEDSKIRIIFPCVDTKKMLAVPRKKHTQLTIGTISRLVDRKNILAIVKALTIVHQKLKTPFTFHLAGDGNQKELILNELASVKYKWEYFGRISDVTKLNEFYPTLDIFVLPVLELPESVEGFGIVYIEANCFGIPVVASEVSGVTDAVKAGYSGVYANPTDTQSIADKIIELVKTKDSYYDNARAWAKKFDAQVICAQFEKLYP